MPRQRDIPADAPGAKVSDCCAVAEAPRIWIGAPVGLATASARTTTPRVKHVRQCRHVAVTRRGQERVSHRALRGQVARHGRFGATDTASGAANQHLGRIRCGWVSESVVDASVPASDPIHGT
jgi:hypothetical protein